jgi:hypothetical protein
LAFDVLSSAPLDLDSRTPRPGRLDISLGRLDRRSAQSTFVMVLPHPVYAVDRLLKRRLRHRQVQYLVRWTGYGRDEDSWEPRTSFSDNRRMLREANALDTAALPVQPNHRTAKRELAMFGEIFLQLVRADFLKEIRRASLVKEHCTDRSGLQGGRGRQLACTCTIE